jgi:hypothetical protein
MASFQQQEQRSSLWCGRLCHHADVEKDEDLKSEVSLVVNSNYDVCLVTRDFPGQKIREHTELEASHAQVPRKRWKHLYLTHQTKYEISSI